MERWIDRKRERESKKKRGREIDRQNEKGSRLIKKNV